MERVQATRVASSAVTVEDNEGEVAPLYVVRDDIVSHAEKLKKNKSKSWRYGYNEKYDLVVISKDGTIGDIYEINSLRIALPSRLTTEKHIKRSSRRADQFWVREDLPPALKSIKNQNDWNSRPPSFRGTWSPYIDTEFERRENGVFFMNNGDPTYITGVHYFYLKWCRIDGQYPGFREANRVFFIYWEACKADPRSFGMVYLKIRRSGFSYMASGDLLEAATLARDSHLGILSKTGPDAKKLFTGKLVPMNRNLPFFFSPIQDGMDKPRTELLYQVPAKKISRKNMYEAHEDTEDGLDTVIDWLNTDSNSYDGAKLLRLVHDESGKWTRPADIEENWDVTKTCLRLGSKIIGKCMMGSTCNSQSKGGEQFKNIYDDSDPSERDDNGRTLSGLYRLFIPMEWNYEGHIDKYGMPVFYDPKPHEKIYDDKGERIKRGAISMWEAEVEARKHKPAKQNEYYRQYPRTEAHAFRDDAVDSVFNLTQIYDQVDYNDSILIGRKLVQGNFSWMNGRRFTRVIFTPNPRGRFLISWFPPESMKNNVRKVNGLWIPGNKDFGAFGGDTYDISGTVGGGGSNAAIHGLTSTNLTGGDVPSNKFFLEYIARPKTAEIMFEDGLMALWFYGMPGLFENNKPRFLYHLKHADMRKFSLNRPDKPLSKLSKTEKELGGVPSASEDMINTHASALESWIDQNVGYDVEGTYRDPDKIGDMPFNRTLRDWATFDISNRTKHDASISSGYAIMANRRHIYSPKKKSSEIKVNFARHDHSGNHSRIIYE